MIGLLAFVMNSSRNYNQAYFSTSFFLPKTPIQSRKRGHSPFLQNKAVPLMVSSEVVHEDSCWPLASTASRSVASRPSSHTACPD